jgi:hypothetical protein
MIARNAVAKQFNRGLILLTVLVLVTLAPVAHAQTQAQAAAAAVAAAIQPPSFDVISVKPNKNSIGAHGLIVTEFTADGFRGVNVPVHTLLLQAYGLHEGETLRQRLQEMTLPPSRNSTPISVRRCYGRSSQNASS